MNCFLKLLKANFDMNRLSEISACHCQSDNQELSKTANHLMNLVMEPSDKAKYYLIFSAFCFSGFFPQSKHMHVNLMGDSESAVGVNVSLNDCPSSCVSPLIDCSPPLTL